MAALVPDDARGTRDVKLIKTSPRRIRRARKGRTARAILLGIAVGAHLARIFDGERALLTGKKSDHGTGRATADGACCRGIARDIAPAAHEGFVPGQTKALIALETAFVEVNLRQVVPDAQQVRIAAAVEQCEQTQIVSQGLLLKVAVTPHLELDHAEQDNVIARAANG